MFGFLTRGLLPALALFVPLALAVATAHAQPRRYTLTPGTSRLAIHVGKTGVFGFAGHEHEIVAGTFHGTATFDPDRIAQSTVDLTFDAGDLRVEGKREPAADVSQVQTAMLGTACLNAQRFPAIHFVSKTVTAVGAAGDHGHELSIAGELTLHGVTRPLTVRVHLDVKGDALDATGSTTLRQTEFGITPISKAGVVKVKDELTLSWQIRGTAK